ncbi:MAG: gliding motility-associated C-terminal domain-containing protein [Bacteroidota bacterium]
MNQRLLILAFLLFACRALFAQGDMCVNIQGFCSDSGISFPASTNTVAEGGNQYGCLGSQPNPAWYYLQIDNPGDIEILITNTNSVDVDFIVWGPFASLPTALASCGSLTAGVDFFDCDSFTSTCSNGVPCNSTNPCPSGQAVDCSFNPQANEVIDIPNALAGEVYILLITNFSGLATDIQALQISGTGSTNCDIVTCGTVGFNDLSGGSPYNCNGGVVDLVADPFTGIDPVEDGFITPAFGISLLTDANASIENTLEIWDGPNGTGTLIGYWGPTNLGGNYQGQVFDNQVFNAFGEYFDPTGNYSLVWCDSGPTGNFSYSVIDYADNSVITTGAFDHSVQSCYTVNIGAPQGTATFSGPGVTDMGNGMATFDPSGLTTGTYTITYTWDDGGNCQGTATQDIDVSCINCQADAGTFNTPNGTVICFGDDFLIQSNGDFAGSFETGDNMDMVVPDGGISGVFDGVVDADGDGVNGVVFAAYSNPPVGYILDDPNFLFPFASEPNGTLGTALTNNVTAVTQYWVTSVYAFDEDLDGSGQAILGFDANGDGTAECFSTNEADAVLVTLLPDITTTVTQTCNPDFGVDIAITVSGGLPAFDGSSFSVSGNGPGGTLANGGTYTITNYNGSTFFTVVFTDNNGCSVTVTEQSIQVPNISLGITLESCAGGMDGTIDATASSATPPYSYVWFPGGETTSSITGVGSGGYAVTVSDVNACASIASVDLPAGPTIDVTVSVQDITCNGFNDGEVDLTISGGQSPYTFTWSNTAQTTEDVTGLAPGAFSVTVEDGNGCSTVESGLIIEPVALAVSFSGSSSPSCSGDCDGDISLGVSGGNPPYTYLWSNMETTQDISGLCAGFYQVTVQDNNACTGFASGTLGNPPFLQVSVDAITDASCNGSMDGIVELNTAGGTGDYTYEWSHDGVLNDDIATGLNPGVYDITLTDNNGCTSTLSTLVGSDVVITANETIINADCNGAFTGSITLNPTGSPNLPYTYTWDPITSTGNMNQANNLPAGTFGLTIEDNLGCFTATSFPVNEPVPIGPTTSVLNDVSCFGFADGAVNVSATGGILPYTYQWDSNTGFQTTATVTGLAANTYVVLVTDNNGCSESADVLVSQPAELVVNAAVDSDLLCFGDTNGSATASPNGGTGAYTYLWDNGETDATAIQLSGGSHTVTVTDANTCETVSSVNIIEPAQLFASVVLVNNVDCNGAATGSANVGALGGMGDYTYLWDNGETTITATALDAGLHLVTVTDNNACEATAGLLIDEPDAIVLTLTEDDPLNCFGDMDGGASVSTTGGTPPYSYLWDNGETDISANMLTGGVHFVTVTDNNACEQTGLVNITEPGMIMVPISFLEPSCNGFNDGSATAIPSGGFGAYTFEWEAAAGGQTTATATGLAAGTYVVTVTDGNSCSQTASEIVTQPDILGVTISDIVDVLCFGDTNGQAIANVTGGTLPYTYAWDNGETNSAALMLDGGSHVVDVTDGNGCTAQGFVTIAEPTALNLNLDGFDPTCNGASTGVINSTLSGGTPNYTYVWNTGSTNAGINNLPAGDYSLTVIDENGCTITEAITLTEPSSVSAMVTSQSTSCFDSFDGQADAVASGGSGGYTYLWDNGEVGPSAELLTGGPHTVTVLDQFGCFVVQSFNVPAPSPLTPSDVGSTPVSCFGESDGTASFQAIGGTAPYTYAWTDITGNPLLTEVGVSSTLSGIPAGSYQIGVVDANGCFMLPPVLTVTVLEPAAPVAISVDQAVDPSCAGGDDGFISIIPSGGTPDYQVTWSTGDLGVNVFNLSAGSYSVTVVDANGCSETAEASLDEPTPISGSAFSEPVSCFGFSDGAIVVDTAGIAGGNPPYIFSIGSGVFQSGPVFPGVQGGNYTVIIQDANGCEFETSAQVDEPAELIVELGPDLEVDLGDSTQLFAQVNVFNPEDLIYSWDPPIFLSCIDCPRPTVLPLQNVTYTVEVIDTSGCTGTDQIFIDVDKNREVYIPNAFTPNGDGVNDVFMIFGGLGVAQVDRLIIYDRWGEVLFDAAGFQPNNPTFAWDGTLNGKVMNPGVFVYYAEVTFIDGVVEAYKGDITLVR